MRRASARATQLEWLIADLIDAAMGPAGGSSRLETDLTATNQDGWRGAEMGDKGGKKDKEKNKQQQVKKHQQEAQLKQDKVRAGNLSRSE